VAAGQPLTFSGYALTNANITASTGIFGPFTQPGTVVQLDTAGTYRVNFQTTVANDASLEMAYGTSLATMLPIPYTAVGRSTGASQIVGDSLITVSAGSYLAIIAAPGNASALDITPTASTTNTSSTTLVIQQIG
jgi:hypothetical protein